MKNGCIGITVLGCFLLLSAHHGFAYQWMNEGCLVSGCHSLYDPNTGLMWIPIHKEFTCDKCHETKRGNGSVSSAKCIACHPAGNSGQCNLTNTNMHAAIGNCATCHAEDCKSICPAAAVLGADDPRLEKLRDFRDTVLAKSALGRMIISSYYTNADSIKAALEKNPALKAFSSKALQSFMPVLELFM